MTQNRPSKSDRRESGIVQRMRKSVRQHSVESPHVLLACSAGKDSVALAWLLGEMQRLGLLTFSIAHIHHGQHQRADLAANAVREIGRVFGVPVFVHNLKQDNIDSHVGVGLEEAMRRERYLALASIATDQNAACIALAHHQVDQAESILLHLMRGTGLDGLTGMRARETRQVPWWDQSADQMEVELWRPLIGESGNGIAEIAAASNLPIIEDPTNIDPKFRRNAIRHRVLPVIEDISEGATAAIARSAEVVAGDLALLDSLTMDALEACQEGDGVNRATLVALPFAMQRRVARLWISIQLPYLELASDRVDAIVEMATRNRGGSVVELGAGRRVQLRSGILTID